MATPGVKIMTSDDIFFEVNGQRVAGVESYTTKYTNDVKLVDAFGQNTPIGYTLGSKSTPSISPGCIWRTPPSLTASTSTTCPISTSTSWSSRTASALPTSTA